MVNVSYKEGLLKRQDHTYTMNPALNLWLGTKHIPCPPLSPTSVVLPALGPISPCLYTCAKFCAAVKKGESCHILYVLCNKHVNF